jgi:SNF2 family DNA or RNA helicase
VNASIHTGRKTYGRLSLQAQRWVISEIPPHVAIKLKAVFPKIPKTQVGVFDFLNTPEACTDLEWFLQRYPLELEEAARAELQKGRQAFDDRRNGIEKILLPDWQPTGACFKPGYAPYLMQSQAAEITRRLGRLLIVDDAGLGKTWSALTTIGGSQFLPAAIVVQAHLANQWVDEFIKPYTYLVPHIIKSTTPYSLPPANAYVFSYPKLAGWVDVAQTGFFKAAIFDEIQELRHGDDTEKGKAAKVFAHNALLSQGLSATPIYNYGSEIFRIIEVLAPGALGSWEEFTREWCSAHNGKWIVNDPDALGTYLRELQLMVRRERLGGQINRLVIEIGYDEEIEADAHALARALAMRVVSGSFTERGQAARELDMFARKVTGLAKAREVAAYVRMLIKSGRPVLLAGWHRDVYAIWLQELAEFKPLLYTGSETAKQKDRAKRAFLAGDTDLLIMSLRSGTGIDGIQKRCADAVIGELDWSPKVHDQFIWRLDRPGQEQEVTAHFLFTNSGSDPVVMAMNGIKADQSHRILNPLQAAPAVHSDDSKMRTLAEHYLAKG